MLDKIKAEIQKVLDVEGDSESAKAQALALLWCLELIDKYAEQEPQTVCDLCRFDYLDGYCGDCPAMTKAEWER